METKRLIEKIIVISAILVILVFDGCVSDNKKSNSRQVVVKDTTTKKPSIGEYEEQYTSAVHYVDSLVKKYDIKEPEMNDSLQLFMQKPDIIYLPHEVFNRLTTMQKIAYTLNYKEMYTQNCVMCFFPENEKLEKNIYINIAPKMTDRIIAPDRKRQLKAIKNTCFPILDFLLFTYQNDPDKLADVAELYKGIDSSIARKSIFKLCKKSKNAFFCTLLLIDIPYDIAHQYSFCREFSPKPNDEYLSSLPYSEANKAKTIDVIIKVFPDIAN